MGRKVKLIEHVPRAEVERLYKEERDSRRKERLRFILELYDGQKIKDAARMIRRSDMTGKRWVKSWNRNGLEGLMPAFYGKGGGSPYLDEKAWNSIIDEIRDKGMALDDVILFVKNRHGVSYSYKGVWNRLRRKKNGARPVHYGKPFKMHAKRPPDAGLILKKGSKRQE